MDGIIINFSIFAMALLRKKDLPENQKQHWTRNMKLTLATFAALVLVFPMSGSSQNTQKEAKTVQEPSIRFLNRAPAGYSHVVEVRGGRTLYISGQVALDREGKLVGPGDFTTQVKQVFANLKARFDEAGASFNDVVKLNYYVTDATNIQNLRDVRDGYINREHPPASTLVVVKQLFREEFLIEVDAIAVVKD
jgi:enamine deaminase RidA (YjgF/YER057c/UK114 family)